MSLSAQELIDCSFGFGNLACEGGYVTKSFTYIKRHGISTQDKYPYKGEQNNCTRVSDSGIKLTGFVEVTPKESALRDAVGKTNLSIFIWLYYIYIIISQLIKPML